MAEIIINQVRGVRGFLGVEIDKIDLILYNDQVIT